MIILFQLPHINVQQVGMKRLFLTFLRKHPRLNAYPAAFGGVCF